MPSSLLRASCILARVTALTCIFGAQLSSAQTFSVLYSFTGGVDGGSPSEGLVRNTQGNLYGTTYYGGTGSCTENGVSGCGTVFKVTPDGIESVLHSFQQGRDGAHPWAGVTIDMTGNLFGTTTAGGLSNLGIAYKLDTSGAETILHYFRGGSRDGASPYSGLVLDNLGSLWGTNTAGGNPSCGIRGSGCGTIFKLRNGKETILHRFSGSPDDGTSSFATNLLPAKAEIVYGVTSQGGTSNNGTIYKLNHSGKMTILYNFRGKDDGCEPSGQLAMDKQGNIYGTTSFCGRLGVGTLYKFSKSGLLTVLYTFQSAGTGDGASPYGGVTRDARGNLYGTTLFGGTGCDRGQSCGTVFKFSRAGKMTILHRFNEPTDGAALWGSVTLDGKGNLYGTTSVGGPGSAGTVWKIAP